MGIRQHGYEIRSGLVRCSLLEDFLVELKCSENINGIRNAEKKFNSVRKIVNYPNIIDAATRILKCDPKIVRVILFDKTPDKNWLVSWHQDKTVALSSKADIEGWGPWTIKDQTHHVQPPIDVLESMVTFRIHIDPAGDTNGCLRVLPYSHNLGILKQSEINDLADKKEAVSCIANAGDTLIMRPHILHSSSKAIEPNHRRIIHIEFSSYELPEGIDWA